MLSERHIPSYLVDLMVNNMDLDLIGSIDYRDDQTPVVYLEVPTTKVVLFQAFFELYEGLGLVRTLDMRKNLLCVITTASQIGECCSALSEIKSLIGWKPAAIPSHEDKDRYLGYFKNAKDNTKV